MVIANCINIRNDKTLVSFQRLDIPMFFKDIPGRRGVIVLEDNGKKFSTFFPARY